MAKNINIGGRLHSVATGNIVSGADEILDDNLNKTQAQINEEVNTILKTQGSIIEGLNSQNYESYTATDETTDITDVLPDLGVVNTIYRLGNWNGTQYDTTKYAEYAWINTGIDQGEYVLLDVKNYGIDDKPTAGSDNLVKSGGVFNAYKSNYDRLNNLGIDETYIEKPLLLKTSFDYVLKNRTSVNVLFDGIVEMHPNGTAILMSFYLGKASFIGANSNVPAYVTYTVKNASGTNGVFYVASTADTISGHYHGFGRNFIFQDGNQKNTLPLSYIASQFTDNEDVYLAIWSQGTASATIENLRIVIGGEKVDYASLSNSKRESASLFNIAGSKSLDDITSGNKVPVYNFKQVIENFLSRFGGVYQTYGDDGIWKYAVPNDYYWFPLSFTPPSGSILYVKLKYRLSSDTTQHIVFNIDISNGISATYEHHNITSFFGNPGEYKELLFMIDPAHWQVYGGIGNTFYLWMFRNSAKNTGVCNLEIFDIEAYYVTQNFVGDKIQGANVKELFQSADAAISELSSEKNSELILITPFGTKYAVQLDDSGNFIKIPVVPIKAAFCGNSLFSRMASETGRGWTYYIDYALRDMGMATSHYFQNGGLETCTTNAAVDSAVDTIVSGLTGDETLVIVQLGDNALTVERQTVWAYAVKKCLSEIRQKCPNARVYWMAAWYSTIELMDKIKAGVKATGSYLCDITGMIGGVNSNHIGGTYQPFYNGDGQSHVSTLENVTNVTESTTNNITVTFTLDGTSYTSDEFSVDNWSLSGTTLTYESLSQIITSQGIASHPSDLGFRKIANKFLKDAGVTDTDYYNVG